MKPKDRAVKLVKNDVGGVPEIKSKLDMACETLSKQITKLKSVPPDERKESEIKANFELWQKGNLVRGLLDPSSPGFKGGLITQWLTKTLADKLERKEFKDDAAARTWVTEQTKQFISHISGILSIEVEFNDYATKLRSAAPSDRPFPAADLDCLAVIREVTAHPKYRDDVTLAGAQEKPDAPEEPGAIPADMPMFGMAVGSGGLDLETFEAKLKGHLTPKVLSKLSAQIKVLDDHAFMCHRAIDRKDFKSLTVKQLDKYINELKVFQDTLAVYAEKGLLKDGDPYRLVFNFKAEQYRESIALFRNNIVTPGIPRARRAGLGYGAGLFPMEQAAAAGSPPPVPPNSPSSAQTSPEEDVPEDEDSIKWVAHRDSSSVLR